MKKINVLLYIVSACAFLITFYYLKDIIKILADLSELKRDLENSGISESIIKDTVSKFKESNPMFRQFIYLIFYAGIGAASFLLSNFISENESSLRAVQRKINVLDKTKMDKPKEEKPTNFTKVKTMSEEKKMEQNANQTGSFWICSCGVINQPNTNICRECLKPKQNR
jgi:hypothetical protein